MKKTPLSVLIIIMTALLGASPAGKTAFLEDFTFPDEPVTAVAAGQEFFKGWEVEANSASTSRKIPAINLPQGAVATDIQVPALKSGERASVWSKVTAPQTPGLYKIFWGGPSGLNVIFRVDQTLKKTSAEAFLLDGQVLPSSQ